MYERVTLEARCIDQLLKYEMALSISVHLLIYFQWEYFWFLFWHECIHLILQLLLTVNINTCLTTMLKNFERYYQKIHLKSIIYQTVVNSLISIMLSFTSFERPNLAEISEHEWLQGPVPTHEEVVNEFINRYKIFSQYCFHNDLPLTSVNEEKIKEFEVKLMCINSLHFYFIENINW